MCDISYQEAVIPRLLALKTQACAAFGVFGYAVDAQVDGGRVGFVADEAVGKGAAEVLVLHEAVCWIGAGEEVEGAEEGFGGEVVGEDVCAAGGRGGGEECEDGG